MQDTEIKYVEVVGKCVDEMLKEEAIRQKKEENENRGVKVPKVEWENKLIATLKEQLETYVFKIPT